MAKMKVDTATPKHQIKERSQDLGRMPHVQNEKKVSDSTLKDFGALELAKPISIVKCIMSGRPLVQEKTGNNVESDTESVSLKLVDENVPLRLLRC